MMAAIVLEVVSTPSLTVLVRVVTPILTCAWSGATLTLPSPVTTTRACGVCGEGCANAPPGQSRSAAASATRRGSCDRRGAPIEADRLSGIGGLPAAWVRQPMKRAKTARLGRPRQASLEAPKGRHASYRQRDG